jgi:Ca2+-binding RTX toxin-like protein
MSNNLPTGTLTISNIMSPEGDSLTVVNAIADADGLTDVSFSYQWQSSADGVTWDDIAGATETSFIPGNLQVGQMLRVVASYVDNLGTAETFEGSAIITGDNNANLLKGTDGDDVIFGLGANDNIYAGAGNDVLDGGTGTDVMQGGTGDDIYFVDDNSNPGVDTVGERENEGNDTVKTTTASYTLNSNVENLISIRPGSDPFTGIGNTLDNLIVGGDGNDTLIGGGGADDLEGGAGIGDTASYETSTAAVIASLANPAVNTGDAAGDTYLGIENLTGGSDSDTLIGDANNNVLNGGRGNDTLDGGAGNDTLDGGAGNDTLVFRAGFGNDQIIAFGDSRKDQDVIEFHSVFASFAAVQDAMQQVGADVVITSPTDGTITLTNVLLGNLGADDFRFI